VPWTTDLALIAAGPLAGLVNPDQSREEVSAYAPKKREVVVWVLRNLEDGSELAGQFPAEDPVLNLATAYGEHTSLNRQNPIVQFLHGDSDTFSFVARFYALHAGDKNPSKSIATLQSWRLRDDKLARPPRVSFTFGNIIPFPEAVITGLNGLTYSEPKQDGDVREVSVTVNLLRYVQYSLESKPEPETRYHRTKTGDYYELLAWQEYRSALLGDAIRKEHSDQQELEEGDIVRLPSYGAIRGTTVQTSSTPLYSAYSQKDTAQRRLRQDEFARHDRSYVSAVVPEGL
jgi:hypothetical protein